VAQIWTLHSAIARLREHYGARLGQRKATIEARYGAQIWDALYRSICESYGAAIRDSRLLTTRADPAQELTRLRALVGYETAACAWLDGVCAQIEARLWRSRMLRLCELQIEALSKSARGRTLSQASATRLRGAGSRSSPRHGAPHSLVDGR
jgi:hypothetical protein